MMQADVHFMRPQYVGNPKNFECSLFWVHGLRQPWDPQSARQYRELQAEGARRHRKEWAEWEARPPAKKRKKKKPATSKDAQDEGA